MSIRALSLLGPCLCIAALLGSGCGGEPPQPTAPAPAPALAPSQPTDSVATPVSQPPVDPGSPPAPAPAASEDPKDYPGLAWEVVRPGDGETLQAGQVAQIRYTGTLRNGREFDSSWSRGTAPVPFDLANVVKGFRLGLVGMKVGERRRLVIPGELGYGAAGNPGAGIGPNETLIFDVELVRIEPRLAPPATGTPPGR